MRIEQICLKISAWIAWRETYQIRPLSTHLFSHCSIPLMRIRIHLFTLMRIRIRIRIRLFTLMRTLDRDPAPYQSDANLLYNVHPLHASIVSVNSHPRLHFLSSKVLNFDFFADPTFAIHSHADPDPASQKNTDPHGSGSATLSQTHVNWIPYFKNTFCFWAVCAIDLRLWIQWIVNISYVRTIAVYQVNIRLRTTNENMLHDRFSKTLTIFSD